jgi:hypothetical protein
MKVLLDIKDQKAGFILELLKSFSYVKTQKLTETKAEVLADLSEAVQNMKLVKKGKLKARPAKELLNEL